MITIIAGKINAGKSTKMEELYELNHKGDGFVCKKVFEYGKFTGFEFVRLSTKEAIPFMKRACFYNKEKYYDKSFRDYYYSSEALNEVLNVIKSLIKNKVEPLYLDEIGFLEISHKGHDQAFIEIIKSKLDAVICVRDQFVHKVIEHYRLSDFRIVGLKNE